MKHNGSKILVVKFIELMFPFLYFGVVKGQIILLFLKSKIFFQNSPKTAILLTVILSLKK